MAATRRIVMDSPLGPLTLVEKDGVLAELRFGGDTGAADTPTALLREAAEQLAAYFAKQLRIFDLPLAPPASAFQAKVRAAMLAIPYGATRRYGDLAREIGVGPRTIGQACGHNPLPVIVPCHRVIAAGGRLGGYSGGSGLPVKRRLLALEAGDLFAPTG